MPVPKFVCGVGCASGFASPADGDVVWDTRSIGKILSKPNLNLPQDRIDLKERWF
jgi:hypothetical protein